MKSRGKVTVVELVDRFGRNARNFHAGKVRLQALSSYDLQRFTDALAKNMDITQLILSGSRIGDEGVMLLAEALQNNTKLAVLHLADTGITNIGAKILIELLQKNQTLTEINVSSNFIDLSYVSKLNHLLTSNKAFQEAISSEMGVNRLMNP